MFAKISAIIFSKRETCVVPPLRVERGAVRKDVSGRVCMPAGVRRGDVRCAACAKEGASAAPRRGLAELRALKNTGGMLDAMIENLSLLQGLNVAERERVRAGL